MSKEKKKFKDTKFGKMIMGLVSDGLQSLPVVGTIVTAFKSETIDSPKGKINLGKSEYIRLAIGLIIAILLYYGTINETFLAKITTAFEWVGKLIPTVQG